jgi:hypothetical protein
MRFCGNLLTELQKDFSKATIYFFLAAPQSEKPLVLLQKAVRLAVEVVKERNTLGLMCQKIPGSDCLGSLYATRSRIPPPTEAKSRQQLVWTALHRMKSDFYRGISIFGYWGKEIKKERKEMWIPPSTTKLWPFAKRARSPGRSRGMAHHSLLFSFCSFLFSLVLESKDLIATNLTFV